MAHSTVTTPVAAASAFAQQRYGGSDNRQEMTLPVPESGTAIGYDVTTASTTAVAANSARVALFLQNPSGSNTVWLALGADTAALNAGIWLPPGASVTLTDQRAVKAIGTQASGTTRLVGYDLATT